MNRTLSNPTRPMENHDDPDDLRRLAPRLASVPRVDPFVVPAGFADDLPRSLRARLAPVAGPARPRWASRLVLATPMLAAMVGAWMLFNPYDGEGTATDAPDLTDVAAAASIAEEDLLQELSETELAALATEPEAPSLTAAELADYYELTGTDVSELIESL